MLPEAFEGAYGLPMKAGEEQSFRFLRKVQKPHQNSGKKRHIF
jgi:hypothetical protein